MGFGWRSSRSVGWGLGGAAAGAWDGVWMAQQQERGMGFGWRSSRSVGWGLDGAASGAADGVWVAQQQERGMGFGWRSGRSVGWGLDGAAAGAWDGERGAPYGSPGEKTVHYRYYYRYCCENKLLSTSINVT
jgi:hypothetical protein